MSCHDDPEGPKLTDGRSGSTLRDRRVYVPVVL
jgi:hypothetical protein